MNIFVVGNSLIKQDNLPLRLLPKLKKQFPKIIFLHIDPNEDFIPPKNEPCIIIDTVVGIKTVTIFNNIDAFLVTRSVSPHDYDLGFHLKLLKKMGKLGKITIIGIPPTLSLNEAWMRVYAFLRSFSKSSTTSSSSTWENSS